MSHFNFILSKNHAYLIIYHKKPFPSASYGSHMPAINFHCTVTSIQNTILLPFQTLVTGFDFCNDTTTNVQQIITLIVVGSNPVCV